MMTVTVSDIQKRVRAGLSMRARAGYTLLLVVSMAMTGVTLSLLATEPALPRRTQLTFVALTLIGAAWTALAAWVLARRHVLFAQHRIAASWLAMAASSIFLAGSIAFRAYVPGATIGVATVMLSAAALCVVQARRYRERLIARRDSLTGN